MENVNYYDHPLLDTSEVISVLRLIALLTELETSNSHTSMCRERYARAEMLPKNILDLYPSWQAHD